MKDIISFLTEASANRRDILRRKLTEFTKIIYDDGGDLVIGGQTVAQILDDGTIVFPKNFNEELAKFIVICYIYKNSDWDTDETNYYIYIGDPNKDGKEVKW